MKGQIESEFYLEDTNLDLIPTNYSLDNLKFYEKAFSDSDLEEMYYTNVKGEQRAIVPLFAEIGGYN
ncbi:MAG: hypothetical protein ABIM31_01765 [candidate division WOR-3 bacterium]